MSYIWFRSVPSRLGEWAGEPDFVEPVLNNAKKFEKHKAALDYAFSPLKTLTKKALHIANKAPTDEEKTIALIERVLAIHGLI